jgi:hypothetical protein
MPTGLTNLSSPLMAQTGMAVMPVKITQFKASHV